nr:glycosyltransferase family 1 protein [Oceanusvirus sp.]
MNMTAVKLAHSLFSKALDAGETVLDTAEDSVGKNRFTSAVRAVTDTARAAADWVETRTRCPPPSAYKGFSFPDHTTLNEHRSGWNHVMNIMLDEFHQPDGPRFVDFAERVWGWHLPACGATKNVYYDGKSFDVSSERYSIIGGRHVVVTDDDIVLEYDVTSCRWRVSSMTKAEFVEHREPGVIDEDFVAVFHNPPDMPDWFDYGNSPQSILERDEFKRSLPNCRGVFVFSEYLADWLKERLPDTVPVSVIPHPTERPAARHMWTPEKFLKNPEKTVVSVGYWLRRLGSVFELAVPDGFSKKWLYGSEHAFDMLTKESLARPETGRAVMTGDVRVNRVSNAEYDRTLSKNVAFIDLYDSSMNNGIVECITRHTPVFVRRLPAVVEHLGKGYPLLFDDLSEVEEKLKSFDNLLAAHVWLVELDKDDKYSKERFVQAVKDSEVFRSIF